MRDKPHPNHRLEWPGGVVPEWARPQGNPNKQRHRGKMKGGHPGGGGGGGAKRERLQKVMAQSGHGSRRNLEILIAQGHITINGQVAKLGDQVGPGDRVKLDGRPISMRFGDPLPQVLLYHKPEGEIVTRDDPQGRATVFEKLPPVQGGRWVSVGRLDINTGGLLIFTTNGELANRLMHPRFEVEREYALRLLGELTEESKSKLLEGVEIEGEKCKFDSIEDRGGEGANHWYHVVLREGKNREVRKMCEVVGLVVSRLMRVRFGSVAMPTFMKRGMTHEMEEPEVIQLLEFAGMRSPEPPAAEPAPEGEEDEDDGQLKFLGRIPAPGVAPADPAFQGQRQGPQGPRQGHRGGQGQPQPQPQGKKGWKQRSKGHRGPKPPYQQPAQLQGLPRDEDPPQPQEGQFQPQDPPQPQGQPRFQGPHPQGQAGPGNGKPGGHRGKRHRNRRGKGQRPGPGPNLAQGQLPPQQQQPPQQQPQQAQSRDEEQPLTNENRRPY